MAALDPILSSSLHNYFGKPDQIFAKRPEPIAEAQDVSSRFGRRLLLLRQNCKLTQRQLADHLGMDRSYISDMENGKTSISLSYLKMIAEGFGLSLADLLEDL